MAFEAGEETMGGLAAAATHMTDPERIWTEASLRLRAEIGEGPFSSYIAPSAVRADGSRWLAPGTALAVNSSSMGQVATVLVASP
jgi:hypothetical protein